LVPIFVRRWGLGSAPRDQTLSFIVLRPVSRTAIAFAKILGGVGSACFVSGLGAVALGVAMGLRGGGWDYVLPLVVGTVIATAAYGGIFTPLGYLTERATLLGLAFVFIWESAVAGTIPGLAATSPWRIGFSAVVGMSPGELLAIIPDFALGSVAPGAGGAALKALIIVGLGTWFTGWILRTRDLA
jgi:ABC-type transport system involved in multi-copper enzyme maturation permease subunit